MSEWNPIVQNNAKIVVDAAFRIVGNLADAEDVAQTVFLEAYTKWKSSEANHWSGLLRQMAVRRAIDLLRARQTPQQLPAAVVDSAAQAVDQDFISRELIASVRNAVVDLPSREAEVFCLIYFEQLSHEDAAAALEMSKSAVAAALSRARGKLSKILRPAEQGESK